MLPFPTTDADIARFDLLKHIFLSRRPPENKEMRSTQEQVNTALLLDLKTSFRMMFPGSTALLGKTHRRRTQSPFSWQLCHGVDSVVNLLRSLAVVDAITVRALITIHAGDTPFAPFASLRRGTRFASVAPNTCATFNASPTTHAISTFPANEQHAAPCAVEASR